MSPRPRVVALAAPSPFRLNDDPRALTGAILPHRLRPPPSRVAALERRALLSRVEQGLAGQLVVVHAPAGFGKTELLSAYYEHMRGPGDRFVWVTIDASDNDPRVFLNDLATTLRAGTRSSGQAALSARAASVEEAIDGVRSAALLVSSQPTTVFLDDFHAAAGAEFRDAFNRLLRSLPKETRLVLASRGRPDIHLSRLRVRDLVAEIDGDALAFGIGELHRLFDGRMTRPEAARFMEATGGWPAIAHLALAALDDKADPDARELALDGRHPTFADFVEEEALGGLSPALRRALYACAVMELFPADLAAGLAGEADVSERLAELVPALQPLPGQPRWLRASAVLRRVLLDRRRADEDTLAALHIRAASWCAERGFFDNAVRHAAHGRDFGLAVEAIRDAGGVNIFLRMGYKVLRRLLADLPHAVIAQSPVLSLCQALACAKEGHVQMARDMIDALKQDGARAAALPPADLEHIDGMIDVYEDRNLGDAQIERLWRSAHDFKTYDTWERGWIYNHLCIAYQRKGDLRAARLTGLKALSCYREERTPYAQIFMLAHVGTVALREGRLSAAGNVLRQAAQLVQETQWLDANVAGLVDIPLASCLYHQGEIAEAARRLGAALPIVARGEGWVDMFARGYATYARARFLSEGGEAGLAVLDEAEVLAVERGLPRLELAAAVLRVELLTRAGFIDSARREFEKLPPIVGDASDLDRWPTTGERHEALAAAARLRNRSGDPEGALALARALIDAADAAGAGLELLAGRVHAIEALHALDRSDEALEQLKEAIALAVPQKATQFLRDGDAVVARALRALILRAGLSAFRPEAAAFLASTLGPLQPRRMGELSNSSSVILTKREAEVLELLARGESNKRIAAEIDLTEAAVKFHVKNLFRKLGVNRRALAGNVARQIGLV